MSNIGQQIKYSVEFDASGLDKFTAQIQAARTQIDDMLKSIGGLAEAFAAVNGKTLKVKQTIVQQSDATKNAVVETESLTRAAKKESDAMAALERDLQKAANGHNILKRAMERVSPEQSKLAESARKSRAASNAAAQAILKQADAADVVLGKLNKLTAATDDLGKKTEGTGLMFLKAFGTFQAAKWVITEVFDSIREGAQNLDIKTTLTRQVAGFEKLVAEINMRTANTVKEETMNKSLALMTSFGLEASLLPESMELVAKAAIRTGQSTEYLTESFGRGVSRMSPLILDNLGLQLKLSDAYENYAKKIGKSTDALTKQEQTTAVHIATLEGLRKTTEGIDLDKSASSAVARFDKMTADIWLRAKELGGTIVYEFDQGVRGVVNAIGRIRGDQAVKELMDTLKGVDPDVSKLFGIDKLTKDVELLGGVADALQKNNSFGQDGIFNAILFGVNNPAKTRKELDDAIEGFRAGAGGVIGDLQQMVAVSGGGLLSGLMTTGFQTLAFEAEATMQLIEEFREGELTDADRLNIKAALRTELEKEFTGILLEGQKLLKDETTTREDLEKFARRIGEVDSRRADKLFEISQTVLDTRKTAEELNRQSDAFVVSVENGLAARAQELAYASDTHILLLDTNKAKAEEERVTKEIQKTLLDIRDEEKAAEKGTNIAKLRQLELAKRIAQAGYDGAVAIWKAEDARLDGIIKAGKVAVKAEITRLGAYIKQNEALLTQIKIYDAHPAFSFAASASVAKLRQDTESAKDSLARLNAELNKMGRGGKKPGDRDPKGKPPRTPGEVEYPDPNKYMLAIAKMMDNADEVFADRSIAGLIDTKFGISPEHVEMFGQNYRELLEMIKKEFGSLEAFTSAYFQGDAARVKAWLADYEASFNHFAAVETHIIAMKDFAEQADLFHAAMGTMNAGFAGLGDIFGKDGDKYVTMISDLTAGMESFTQALGSNADAYGLVVAGSSMLTAVSRNIIKDLRVRAVVEGAMQTALSAAAFASGNIPGGIGHAAAAALFFAVAGKGKSGLEKNKTKAVAGGTTVQPRADVHVHIAGTVVQTEAERGMMIQRALREARAGGFR
jgi:hypothetical protein